MRAVLLPLSLLAFLCAALPASAQDMTVKEAIAKLQAEKQFLIDNHIANMQKRAQTDSDVARALSTGELQARSKAFIGQMHDDVIARLRAEDKPGAKVSDQEVGNYVKAFKEQLFALRDAMQTQAHNQLHSDAPSRSLDWKAILDNSRPKREAIVTFYANSPVDHPGPVRLTNTVIETLSPHAPAPGRAPTTTNGGAATTTPGGGNGATTNAPPATSQPAPAPDATGTAPPAPDPNPPGNGVAPTSPEQSASDRLALGDMTGAQNDLNAAADAGTASPDAYALRGEIAMNEGRFSSAVQDAQAALQRDPNNQNALAVLHNSEGRADGAPPDQGGSAPGAAPAPEIAGGYSGHAAYGSSSAGSPESAAAVAAAANALPSSSALSRLSAGQARAQAEGALGMNDLGAARAYVDRALAQEPGNPSLLNLRAQISARGGDYAQAKADAMAGLAISPLDPGLRRTLGYAQVRSKDYRGAIATANGMMERDPQNAYAYALRAHAYGSLGDRDAMMSDLKTAAQLDPSFRPAEAKMEGQLQLPQDSDVLFLFPGETAPAAAAAASPAPAAGSSRGLLVGGAAAGGALLLAGALLAARKRPEPEPEPESENQA